MGREGDEFNKHCSSLLQRRTKAMNNRLIQGGLSINFLILWIGVSYFSHPKFYFAITSQNVRFYAFYEYYKHKK